MSELMRFRLARAPQKRTVESEIRVPLYRKPSHDLRSEMRAATTVNQFETLLIDFLNNPTLYTVGFQTRGVTVLDNPTELLTPINQLERWLTSHGNRPSVKDLSIKLNKLCQTFYGFDKSVLPDPGDLGGNARFLIQSAGINWEIDRQNLSFSIIVAMLRDKEPSRGVYLNRLMLVLGLVELAEQAPDRLRTDDDVYFALRSRSVT